MHSLLYLVPIVAITMLMVASFSFLFALWSVCSLGPTTIIDELDEDIGSGWHAFAHVDVVRCVSRLLYI